MVTADQLRNMTPDEIARQYARDVIATKDNVPGMWYQSETPMGVEDKLATYQPETSWHIYNFLFGGGSLGHPLKPTVIRSAVYRIAGRIHAKVSFLDFTYAKFDGEITEDAVYEEFRPVFEELVRKNREKQSS